MVAVDTNIIVRFLVQDDELQYQKSLEIFKTHNIFIPDTVILEPDCTRSHSGIIEAEIVGAGSIRNMV